MDHFAKRLLEFTITCTQVVQIIIEIYTLRIDHIPHSLRCGGIP